MKARILVLLALFGAVLAASVVGTLSGYHTPAFSADITIGARAAENTSEAAQEQIAPAQAADGALDEQSAQGQDADGMHDEQSAPAQDADGASDEQSNSWT